MVRRTGWAIGAVAVLVGGCVPPPETSGQLLDRLVSAEQITANVPREQALSGIARDAATADDEGLCLRALDKIVLDKSLRDRTAAACAGRLNGLGDRPAADSCVSRITSPGLRDQLLIAYARQPAPPRTSAY